MPEADLPSPEQKRGPLRFKTIDRSQMEWRVFAVETLIAPDHPARAIWEFLSDLDLSEFESGLKATEGQAGQSPYPPQMLIAVWLLACSEGVGSAREISRRCEYHPAYRWLCGDEQISYHTWSSFRTAHRAALDHLFVETLGVLTQQGLVSLQQVMQDGTKIAAVASAHSYHREQTIEDYLAAAEKQVQALGEPEQDPPNRRAETARRRAAAEKNERLQRARAELEKIRKGKSAKQQEQARVSLTEPEARIMRLPAHGFAPAYNAQLSTDAAHGIIVNVSVSQSGSDYQQLLPAMHQIRSNFGKLPQQVVVDGGYTSRENILELDGCTDLIGPVSEGTHREAQRKRNEISDEFAAPWFVFDAVSNTFRCPAGRILTLKQSRTEVGKIDHYYRAVVSDCSSCEHKQRCCPKTEARSIIRIEEDPAVARFRQKVQTEPVRAIYKRRAVVAEFSNCWIKQKLGLRRFHVRGLAKAATEMLWYALAYNLQQWIRLRWRARVSTA